MHIAVLSFTAIENDHRILRTIKALAESGHTVTAVGFGRHPAGAHNFIPLPPLPSRKIHRLATALTQAPAGLIAATAAPLHFLRKHHRYARAALLALKPDVIHANDCLTLPSAMAVKRARGTRLVYDSHEFATEEHADNIRWRLVAQQHVREIERCFIGQADCVITVSEGIARELQKLYAMTFKPTVVRNTPAYEQIGLAPFAQPRRLLFHGIMKRGRGIEATIAALQYLPDCVLTLRGDGAPLYEKKLRSYAAQLGVDSRVSFEAAVRPEDVVRRAADSHIGVFCAPTETRHNRFAMPNKIFEYFMAGLAVVVAADTDLAELVAEYKCGVTAASSTPEAIAAAINDIQSDALQTMRMRALEAARHFSWENERKSLIRLYEQLDAAPALHTTRAQVTS